MAKLIIDSTMAGQRIDKVLACDITGATRSQIQKWLKDGLVSVNGKPARPSYVSEEGDIIEWEKPEAVPMDAVPQNIPLDIVYEDDSLLVINKPRGLVVHPAPGNPDHTLVNAILFHTAGTLSGVGGALRPGIVHRIDKDTTGLLVVAKNDMAHLNLSEQLQKRDLHRIYYTLVHGSFKEESGIYENRIDRDPSDRKKYRTVQTGGRDARTNFTVMESFGAYSLVQCSLVTGRTHQIRVHMKYNGHPVVGDKTYGVKNEEFHLDGQLLHAGKIQFFHPVTNQKMEFKAPIPADFKNVLQILYKKKR